MPRILIVDDEPTNLELLAAVLTGHGYQINVARSGQQALDTAIQVAPDLILLDLVMEHMDGLEACRRLKQIPVLADVPVIFLTAMDDEEHTILGFEAGAVDYVTKPFSPRILLARVATHIKLLQNTRQLEAIAQQDGLTGLHNRRAFDQRIDSEWRRSRRGGHGIGLLMLDVDYFKNYNDSYGHPEGDQALKRVAKVLRAVAHRASDFTARYGGEEFVALCTECDAESLRELGQRICDAVAAELIPHRTSKAAEVLTVSIGGAWRVARQDQHYESLIKAADQCLYEAKEQGRNRVVMSGAGSSQW